jgi:hypothetical protein
VSRVACWRNPGAVATSLEWRTDGWNSPSSTPSAVHAVWSGHSRSADPAARWISSTVKAQARRQCCGRSGWSWPCAASYPSPTCAVEFGLFDSNSPTNMPGLFMTRFEPHAFARRVVAAALRLPLCKIIVHQPGAEPPRASSVTCRRFLSHTASRSTSPAGCSPAVSTDFSQPLSRCS